MLNPTWRLLSIAERPLLTKPRLSTWDHRHRQASKKARVTVLGGAKSREEWEEMKEEGVIVKSGVAAGGGTKHWEHIRAERERPREEDKDDDVKKRQQKTSSISVNFLKSAQLHGYDETLCQADRPTAIINTAPSDTFIIENTMPTTYKTSERTLTINVTAEAVSTREVLSTLSKELRQPLSAFTPLTTNENRWITFQQNILYTSEEPHKVDKTRNAVESMARHRNIFPPSQPSPSDGDLPRTVELQYGMDGMLQGGVPNHRFFTVNSVVDGGCEVGSITVETVLRGVYEGDVVEENVKIVRKEGFLNLSILPVDPVAEQATWVEAGSAAVNGDYRTACVRAMTAVGGVVGGFQDILDTVMSTVGRANMSYVDPWYERNERDVVIDGKEIGAALSLLRKATPEISWATDMLHHILSDDGVGRFKTAWWSIPEPLRERIESAPTSVLWNKLAVERLTRYGVDPVIGDVIRTPLGSIKTIKTDAERVTYSRHDILLPFPFVRRGPRWCVGVVFPAHGVNQTSYEIAMRRVNLHPGRLHPNEVMNSSIDTETYRRLTSLPKDVTVERHDGAITDHCVMTEVSHAGVLNPEGMRVAVGSTTTVQPPPPLGKTSKKKRNMSLLKTVASPGKILTRNQWSQLLHSTPAPPLPATGGETYSNAKTCSSCGVLNHPDTTHCDNCLGEQFSTVEKPVDGGEVSTFKVTATLPRGASIEGFLNEICSPHNWRGYCDKVSKRVGEKLGLLSMIV